MISDADRQAAQLIWDYHQMGHDPRPCEAGIGLGSHDLGVATLAADLYHAGLFPVLVFTGANSPTTRERFPRGEAVHYAEQATALGVPQSAIIIEPGAANTGQNISYSRIALAGAGISPGSVMLISKSSTLVLLRALGWTGVTCWSSDMTAPRRHDLRQMVPAAG